jgi:hypothetical protein
MGVYWQATAYKKDESYITGEIKSRGLYEFNMDLARNFRTSQTVQFRHGVIFFEELSRSNYLTDYGLSGLSDLFFYFNSDDLVDGSNLRRLANGVTCGMLLEPFHILKTLEKLALATNNFKSKDNQNELLGLMQLLIDAQNNDCLVHFYRIE